MDYVEGDGLFDCWNKQSQETRRDIMIQVLDIISQLQGTRLEKPGPLGEGGGRCRGFWFTDYDAGPFDAVDEFDAWFTHKLKIN